MKKALLFLFLITLSENSWGQEDLHVQIIEHHVQQGETVRLISKKYLVPPSEIYRLNRFAIDGISPGMILQIPSAKKAAIAADNQGKSATENYSPEIESATDQLEEVMDEVEKEYATNDSSAEPPGNNSSTAPTSHKVTAGETLTALSRKYGVSVSAIKNKNAALLAGGLKEGQVLLIPAPHVSPEDKASTAVTFESAEFILHTVAPKETLYSISRMYNIPVDEIKETNEQLLARGLQAGQVIKIKAK